MTAVARCGAWGWRGQWRLAKRWQRAGRCATDALVVGNRDALACVLALPAREAEVAALTEAEESSGVGVGEGEAVPPPSPPSAPPTEPLAAALVLLVAVCMLEELREANAVALAKALPLLLRAALGDPGEAERLSCAVPLGAEEGRGVCEVLSAGEGVLEALSEGAWLKAGRGLALPAVLPVANAGVIETVGEWLGRTLVAEAEAQIEGGKVALGQPLAAVLALSDRCAEALTVALTLGDGEPEGERDSVGKALPEGVGLAGREAKGEAVRLGDFVPLLPLADCVDNGEKVTLLLGAGLKLEETEAEGVPTVSEALVWALGGAVALPCW